MKIMDGDQLVQKSMYKLFLRSMNENDFKRIKPLDFEEDNISLDPVDWRYTLTK